MELGRVTYNNLIEDKSWVKKEAKQEKNYLALATQLMSKHPEIIMMANLTTRIGTAITFDRRTITIRSTIIFRVN